MKSILGIKILNKLYYVFRQILRNTRRKKNPNRFLKHISALCKIVCGVVSIFFLSFEFDYVCLPLWLGLFFLDTCWFWCQDLRRRFMCDGLMCWQLWSFLAQNTLTCLIILPSPFSYIKHYIFWIINKILPDICLTTTCFLLDACLMTAWQLLGDYITLKWPLNLSKPDFAHYITTRQQQKLWAYEAPHCCNGSWEFGLGTPQGAI